MNLEQVLHFCLDCGHDQTGELNLTNGNWTCNVCRHTVNLNHTYDGMPADDDITGAAI